MTAPVAEGGPVLTVEEAAAYLRISRGLAFAAVRDGSLPCVRIGRRILIPRRQLEALLDGIPHRPHSSGDQPREESCQQRGAAGLSGKATCAQQPAGPGAAGAPSVPHLQIQVGEAAADCSGLSARGR